MPLWWGYWDTDGSEIDLRKPARLRPAGTKTA